ncbi:MAG TPA: amidase [Stellaceae bacterium]|jgi:aspartyl-tRNA(Asn)/glutamyl-tRNA(Gln) amidotransferase subunit A|nr:amidase [Stellaceae bacterium]
MSTAALPSIAEAGRLIASGALSPVALTEAALARAVALNPKLDAFIEITAERARAAAKRAEAEIAGGRRRGPLHGIPYGLKDIYDAAGLRTTAHSRLLLDNIAVTDAVTTARLEAAGMVLIGKLATHEFATGGPAWDLPFPPARNPWNTEHFTGGSSSGSGAAVAAGIVPLAMGSDTGGSIRLPAAYCGTVGLKPTYGRVSRRGVVPLCFSLDTTGPLTWTVEDAALALQALAGYDPRDPGSANVPVPDYRAGLRQGVAGLRVGYARQFNADGGVGAEQAAALDAAAQVLNKLGADVIEVNLPPNNHFQAVARTISHSESFAIHQQDLRTRPELYARVTRERLMLGGFVTAAQYVRAQRLRRILTTKVDALFDSCDVLLTAIIPGPATVLQQTDDRPWRDPQPIASVFNVTGHPALAQLCGFAVNGLPLSAQLVGRAFDEATVLRVAHAYEQAAGWIAQRPALATLAG